MEVLDVRVGSVLGGRYRLVELAGSGNSAVVYRGHDDVLDRAVAVKILTQDVSDAAVSTRERSEMTLLASVAHHGLVTLFDADIEGRARDGHAFLVMEWVDGPTLARRIKDGPIARHDVRTMAADLAGALHALHSLGIIHRDIKPANILLAPSPFPDQEFTARLADFGVARLIDSARATTTGTVIGTAAYLSPEQTLGGTPAAPADVYSLGLTLLESLTGERAYPGTIDETLAARLSRDPAIPAELGPRWVDLLRGMTERMPAERMTALQVMSALRPADWATEVADDAPTILLSQATQATQATQAIAPARAVQPAPPTQQIQAPDEESAIAAPPPSVRADGRAPRHRRWMLVAAALVLATLAIVLFVVTQGAPSPAPAPSLPTLAPPLDGHLRELMRTVTP